MKQTSIIIILLAFLSCKSQDNKKKLKIPEVGWTLYIPTDSRLLVTAQFDTLFRRTAVNAMNKAYGTKEEEFKELKPLFTISKGQFDILGSTLNPYDSSVYKTWRESYAASKISLINLINKQGDQVKLVDTASSKEIINGLFFEKFYMKTIYPS